MNITNRKNLPASVVASVDPNPHNKTGCISVTTLLKGTKEILLTQRHWDEITVDVAERAYAVYGTSVHLVFERGNDVPGIMKEHEVSMKLEDYTVTGRIDYYDGNQKILGDYKYTSVFKIRDGVPDEWRLQTLMYAYLMSLKGYETERVTFFVFLRDWRRSEYRAKKNQGYPDAPVATLSFDVTKDDLHEAEEFIRAKIALLSEHKSLPDEDIPKCTEAERWATPTTFAVKKQGQKTAVRGASKFSTNAQALGWIYSQPKDQDKYYVEKREGCSAKCADYCDCREFCSFYKNEVLPSLKLEEAVNPQDLERN